MIIDGVGHTDNFSDEIYFWLDISDMPENIQELARLIDKEEYNPCCFGMCVSYVVAEKEFRLAPDEIDANAYYVNNDGDKTWFMVEMAEGFVNKAFEVCRKKLIQGEG